MLLRLLDVEVRKLHGSLALLLAVVSPGLVGVLCFVAPFAGDRAPKWSELIGVLTFPIWAFFLLPMTVTAFTALIAQIEYKPKAWDHLLALPVRRWQVYLAKAVVVVAAVALMTALVFVFAWLGATLGGALKGRPPTGEIPWTRIGRAGATITAAAGLMTVLQLWVALRFANFVVPLGFGIGGTLVAVAVLITNSDKANWFPWLLPFNAVRQEDPAPYILAGAIGGALALALMVVDLSRREMR